MSKAEEWAIEVEKLIEAGLIRLSRSQGSICISVWIAGSERPSGEIFLRGSDNVEGFRCCSSHSFIRLVHARIGMGTGRVVGSIVDQLLNANAKQQIASILGVDLRTAGPRLDCVKSVLRQSDGSLACVTSSQFEPPCTPFANDHAAMIDYAGRNWIDCVYPEGVVDEKKNRGCRQTYHFDDLRFSEIVLIETMPGPTIMIWFRR